MLWIARQHAQLATTPLSLMGLGMRGRFAVDQPTITGRSRLAPDSIQPLFACDHCTFSRVGDAFFFWTPVSEQWNWREESESHCGGKDDSGVPDQHWILICRSPPLRGLDELRERSHGAASIRGRSITLSNQHSRCTLARLRAISAVSVRGTLGRWFGGDMEDWFIPEALHQPQQNRLDGMTCATRISSCC